LAQGLDVVSFLANSGVLPSKGEARKLVQAGGISINRKKIDQVDARIDTALLLHNEFILVQKGKKTYFLVQAN
jgi:tyrosyl-tRNA synthetase